MRLNPILGGLEMRTRHQLVFVLVDEEEKRWRPETDGCTERTRPESPALSRFLRPDWWDGQVI